MIIGIAGKKQVGKNTVGNMLAYYFYDDIRQDNYCCVCSFARRLKEIVSILCHKDLEEYESGEFKDSIDPLTGKTNREVLQTIGSEFRRLFGDDIWIKTLFYDYVSGDTWIVTDVRYKNEADAIKKKGGILIRVNRDTGYNDNHISETDLDDYDKFDYVIDNNSSIKELKSKVHDIYNKIF